MEKKQCIVKTIKWKIINKIFDINQKYTVWFERLRLNVFDTLALKGYINNNCKIDKKYKQDIKNYWKKYKNINTRFHKMYFNVTGKKDVKFVPDNLYYECIDYYFNKWRFSTAIADKNYYDFNFKELNRPKTIVKNVDNIFYDDEYNIIDIQEAINKIKEKLEKCGELLIKPAIDSQGGLNVKVFGGGGTNNREIEEILEKYKRNYIVQELIKQNKDLNKIHSESINTIRVISLLHNGEVIILSSLLRMGINKSRVDNFSAGGVACGIDKNGCLKKYAYNKKGERREEHHPGLKFEGYEIKGYEKILKIVKEQHKRFGHFKLISWDFAIDENYEPVFIEFNIRRGEVDFHQMCNGPIFGDLTDEILEEVFKNKIQLDKIQF